MLLTDWMLHRQVDHWHQNQHPLHYSTLPRHIWRPHSLPPCFEKHTGKHDIMANILLKIYNRDGKWYISVSVIYGHKQGYADSTLVCSHSLQPIAQISLMMHLRLHWNNTWMIRRPRLMVSLGTQTKDYYNSLPISGLFLNLCFW